MLVKDIEGLKYPDDFVTRFFFKEKLFEFTGNVLELGCGNGNNLSLFYQYGWNTIGVDLNINFINQGEINFQNISREYSMQNKYIFHRNDMLDYVKQNSGNYDALVFNGSLYYLSYTEIIDLLNQIRIKRLLHSDSFIYFRVRLLNDYRFGKGKKVANNTFLLTNNETGEENCIITFFSENEFIELISDFFKFSFLKTMHCMLENYQKEKLISLNSDFIVWGKLL